MKELSRLYKYIGDVQEAFFEPKFLELLIILQLDREFYYPGINAVNLALQWKS